MNHRQMVVANVQYKKPSADEAKRTKGLLRYLTYRDGRYGHIRQAAGLERWHDHGLGASIKDIAQRCADFQSKHVLAFTLVFNANPELIAMVPLEQREAFVAELTETALQRFFEARGVDGGIEYAYVTHHRESENPESPGLHDPHTHVLLPGTFYDEAAGERVPLFFSRNKQVNHIELLHQTTEHILTDLMDRYAGLNWELRYDTLEALRAEQRRVVETAPHSVIIDDQQRQWPVWIGTRATDEEHSAIGYFRQYPTDPKREGPTFAPDELTLEFRPRMTGLGHEEAEVLAFAMQEYIQENPEMGLDEIFGLAETLQQMSEMERKQLLEVEYPLPEIEQQELYREPTRSGPDIDF